MRRLLAVGAVAVAAGVLWTTSRDAPPASPQPPTAKQAVEAINRHRVAHELKRLKSSERLSGAATSWSRVLASTGRLYHAHLRPGMTFSWLAETLYRGPGGPVRAWLRSPPHRAILLSRKARLIGVGRSGDVWVGRFAARAR